MLSMNSIMTSQALATELAEKGRVVVVKPNTVLAELVRATNASVANCVTCEGQGLSGFADTVEYMTAGSLEQPSEHSKTSDAYIDEIAQAVNRHVSFAKNVVAPIVVDFAERVNNYMANFKPPEASSQFNIEVADIPEALEDESFIDTLRFYVDKSIVEPSLIPAFGARTNEDLLALLQSGDADLDEAITAWYSRKGAEFFQTVWMSFFQSREANSSLNYWTYRDMMDRMDMFERADTALAIYLFTIKLFDAIPEDVVGATLNQYQNTLAQSRDFAGAALTDFIKRAEGFKGSKTLVISVQGDEKGARVFGPVYRQWLESNGCPEIILGLIISGKRLTLQSLIDEIHDDLLTKWKAYENFYNATSANKYFDYFKDALRAKFGELMAGVTKEEEVFVQTSPNYIGTVNEKFEEELKAMRAMDMDNVYMLALKLVCRSRFYYTDAEMILCDIEEARRINPNIDVREAALIATSNYVFDYLADQMVISDDK